MNTILRDIGDGNGLVNCFEKWGWYITSFKAPPPAKRKTLETVPHRSGSLDFSAIYGVQAYDDREIEIEFKKDFGREWAEAEISAFLAWLYSGGRRPMSVNTPSWIYNAECVEANIGDETDKFFRTVTAKFKADPFKRFGLELTSADAESFAPLAYYCEKSFPLSGGIAYTRIRQPAPVAITATAQNTGACRIWMDVPDEWVGEALLTIDYTYDLAAGTHTILIPQGDYYMAVQGSEGVLNLDWTQLAL